MTNGRQKCMDADCDCQNKQGDQANRYQQNAEGFQLAAARDCQHGGVSLSDAGILRNITGMGYGGAVETH